jgi:hypothetical protein
MTDSRSLTIRFTFDDLPGVGFANSGGLVFVDESAEEIAAA